MKVISIVNMKGGVAKTTLAVNLADALTQRHGKKVLLVDLDPQFNATQCLFSGSEYIELRQKGVPTIHDIFNDSPNSYVSVVSGTTRRDSRPLEEISPTVAKDRLHIIIGDLELYRLEMGTGQGREQRLKRYLDATKAKEKYDYVIIDTPPTPSAWMMSALIASDYYLVPVKPEPLSTTGIDLLRGVIHRCSENFGHPISLLGVVLTIAEINTNVFREAKSFLDGNDVWRGKRFNAHLPKRTAIARGQFSQQQILDLQDAESKRLLANVAKEFLERIGDE
ncbi:ParA family protein [Caenispirillum bisanense]|uniref:Chromosome partitioning protein n=1 Tax=Caenispirillum bisanense TaxID=414052 RepID=A0A286GXM7_9PROT|nr:AAA family ATPase [Caenispirillum bisanense]SOE00297.1 chromosome partitioning protein [Caenispirillum bisanense]